MMTLIFCGVDSVRRWSDGTPSRFPHVALIPGFRVKGRFDDVQVKLNHQE